MRTFLCLALGVMPIIGHAQSQDPVPAPQPQAGDPLLHDLIQQALDHNPDLARARTEVDADRERVPQAKALPDPMLGLGLLNEGFKGIQVGKSPMAQYQLMVTQPLPWPGKRGLRGEIAGVGVDLAQVASTRTRLTLEADVRRAYDGLLLVRGQLGLLDRQEGFLRQALAITRTRYEVGQGAQADLLRAQLELIRLDQTRLAMRAAEQTDLALLNRLCGRTEDTPIPTTAVFEDLALPPEPPVAEWLAQAEAGSPELQAARLGIRQADLNLRLAKRDRYPDLAVSAGLMPRGGLDPMWSVGVSISLPLWSKHKQQRAVSEQEWRRKAQGSEVESVRNLLVQRTRERAAQLESVLASLRIYREGLLVQSEASFQATLAQYETGRVPFLSVLETLNGWLADRSGLLQSLAQAEALRIAQAEFNLGGTPPITSPSLGAGSLAMGGGAGSGMAPSAPMKSNAMQGAANGDGASPSSM